MATLPFSRRTTTGLIHILGWVLLGYLLFFSQWFSAEVRFPPQFWLKQIVFLSMMIGVFYLNTGYLVPRLLVRGQTGRYLLASFPVFAVVGAVLSERWSGAARRAALVVSATMLCLLTSFYTRGFYLA